MILFVSVIPMSSPPTLA